MVIVMEKKKDNLQEGITVFNRVITDRFQREILNSLVDIVKRNGNTDLYLKGGGNLGVFCSAILGIVQGLSGFVKDNVEFSQSAEIQKTLIQLSLIANRTLKNLD